jgi:hypothetical protein
MLGALILRRYDLSDPFVITFGIAAATVLADDLHAGRVFDCENRVTMRRICASTHASLAIP